MLAIGILLTALCAVEAQQCFNGGVYGGPKWNKCYHFIYSPQTYVEAEAVCGAFNGLLVSIANVFEQSFIFGNARNHFVLNDYWIGLSDLTEEGVWKWSDDTESKYFNWITGAPSSDVDDNCVAVRLNNGQWYNTNCDTDKKYFVCQVDTGTPEPLVNATFCPLSSEFEASRERCLHFIDSSQTYSEAELTCGSIQGALVSISDASDTAFVTGRARMRLPRQEYWIGLSNLFDKKEWQWADDTSPNYMNWASGFPSTDASKNCVAARATKGNWYNLECESAGKSFVCESVPVVPDPPTTPAPSCKDGEWIYFWKTNAWYKLLDYGANKSWGFFEFECVEMGAHLASIHSLQENMFVEGIAGDPTESVAIGFQSKGDKTSFAWTDGTETDFTRWYSGYPEIHCGLTTYDWIGNHAWSSHDINRSDLRFGVCKRPNL